MVVIDISETLLVQRSTMPKRVFVPLAIIILGLVILAANLGMLPAALWNLWPLILIIVGLGLLVTSDSDDWTSKPARKTARKSAKKSSQSKRKTTRRKK